MAAMKRIDHIALAVKDLENAIAFFEDIFGARLLYRTGGESMRSAMLQVGEDIISLESEPLDGPGFVAQFLRQRGEGFHHLGIEVDSMDETVAALNAKGIRIPDWRVPGDFSVRKEIVLGTRSCFGNVLQIMEWTYGSDATIDDRIERQVRFTRDRITE